MVFVSQFILSTISDYNYVLNANAKKNVIQKENHAKHVLCNAVFFKSFLYAGFLLVNICWREILCFADI